MALISSIAAALKALGRRRREGGGETYYFDKRKGTVELRTDPRLIVKMELFKRFIIKDSWGFELTVRNNSEETISELLIIFNKKFTIILDKLSPDSMKIKSLEFKKEEFDTEELSVDMSAVVTSGKKGISRAYSLTIPMSSIIKELKELGKITPIQEEEEIYKPGTMDESVVRGYEEEFMRQATIRPRVEIKPEATVASSREELSNKLHELEGKKSELTKSFMKREINYATFTQLTNPIMQEIILVKAELRKLDEK